LKFGNEEEIGKTMSPAKVPRRQGSENSKNLLDVAPWRSFDFAQDRHWRDKFSWSRSVQHFQGKYRLIHETRTATSFCVDPPIVRRGRLERLPTAVV